MSTSPLDPQDIRAAAEVQRELGPEYSDAVIAAFIDRVDRAVAARVEARLAEERQRRPAVRDRSRRTLLKGVALGACAGVLVAGVGLSHVHAANGGQDGAKIVLPQGGVGPRDGFGIPGPGKPQVRLIKPGAPAPVPRPIKPAAS